MRFCGRHNPQKQDRPLFCLPVRHPPRILFRMEILLITVIIRALNNAIFVRWRAAPRAGLDMAKYCTRLSMLARIMADGR